MNQARESATWRRPRGTEARRGWPLVVAVAVLLLVPVERQAARAGQQAITIFAAASLTDVLGEIGSLYEARSETSLRFAFAASSTLARQIDAGAPADIYASANESWVDYLADRGLLAEGTPTYPAGNRLVLVAPAGDDSDRVDLAKPGSLAARLGAEGRLAIGDPAHVPAGFYGRAALKSLGHWDALERRLARADNTRAALALVERGEAPLGIVYRTDASISEKVRIVATFPATSHPRIRYPVAIVRGRETPSVRAFFDFMTGTEARTVFARHGFSAE